jgi:hypothetical protein
MIGLPAELALSISSDTLRDPGNPAPRSIAVAGVTVGTTMAASGKGLRTYWTCPACLGRVLLLYFSPKGLPGCRKCLGVTYRRLQGVPAGSNAPTSDQPLGKA